MYAPPRFQANSPFYNDLKSRVASHFNQKNENFTGNIRLYGKAMFLVTTLVVCWVSIIFLSPPLLWSLCLWSLMAFATAGIGFNVMHDGSHGSFSENKFLNTMAAFSLNVLGGDARMWKQKHTVMHHTFTNVLGHDDDIEVQPFMRMCEQQKRYSLHRFQHIYFVALYCILYILWVFLFDFRKYFRGKIGKTPLPTMTTSQHFEFWGYKLLNLILFVIIPIYTLGFSNFIVGYLLFMVITGFTISIIFQLAHTVEDTHFPSAAENNRMETDWATHQVMTTANFATQSRFMAWFAGGLNFQIEHHLFPHISHIHYPAIHKIVKQTCLEYGIKYVEYPTVAHAVVSHVKFLKQMGTKD